VSGSFYCAVRTCPYQVVRHQRHLDPLRKPTSLLVLDAMVASWHIDRTSPTFRSLMDYVGIRSTGHLHYHIQELQRAGLVEVAHGRNAYVPTEKALRRQAA
jgi:hypothetical protein